jgi:serine protease inhibitor
LKAYNAQKSKRRKQLKDDALEFSSADRLYFSPTVQLKDCMREFFANELQTLDFSRKPEESRAEINSWVESVTKGMIKNLLMPGAITAQTNLVLANAAYFKVNFNKFVHCLNTECLFYVFFLKGKWATKFDEALTTPRVFHVDTQKKTFVPMMSVTGYFNLGNRLSEVSINKVINSILIQISAVNEELGCHVLQLPYTSNADSSISMMIFLPSGQKNQLEYTLSKISPDTLAAALQEGSNREVNVKVPKFTVEKTIELVPVLNRMGLGDLFSPSADLSAFSDTSKLSFDDGVHKAKIEIDENGSTAAAATSLFSFRSARPLEPSEFHCDHPFLYMIYDKNNNVVLFAGIYRGPE